MLYSVLMPGAEVADGATVEYAMLGENVRIGEGAKVGNEPDGSEEWTVATVGPGAKVEAGQVVPASAMIYA